MISRRDVHADPARVAGELEASVFGLCVLENKLVGTSVVYILQLDPWSDFAAHGYPTEKVRLVVPRDSGPFTYPIDDQTRSWRHRNDDPLRGAGRGDLCLWYSRDPQSLRWRWTDGLVAYISVVHRHLQFEEFGRRHGAWPVEDTPHGDDSAGPHPIRSLPLRLRAGLGLVDP